MVAGGYSKLCRYSDIELPKRIVPELFIDMLSSRRRLGYATINRIRNNENPAEKERNYTP